MLASYNRYTFQPHHFILAHGIVLDNVELNTEQYDDNNFECNKENDTQFTWDFPINSSNLFHSSNTSLESLNMKNAVKSKLGTRKVPLQEQIKKHKSEKLETMCSLRIEDFAKIGTDCVRLNLESIVSRKNLKKLQATKSVECNDWSQYEQPNLADESMAASAKRKMSTHHETSNDLSHRVSRKLPEIPNSLMRDAAYQLSKDPVPASSLIRTPSLAEELKAALLAESQDSTDTDDFNTLQNSLPKGFELSLTLCKNDESDFPLNLSELGSPEQIDPVNKYSNFFNDFAVKERLACRKSCCITDADSSGCQSAKNKEDSKMSSVVNTDEEKVAKDGKQSTVADGVVPGQRLRATKTDCRENAVMNSTDTGSGFKLGLDGNSPSYGKDRWVKKIEFDEEKSSHSNEISHQNNTCSGTVNKKFNPTGGPGGACLPAEFDLDEIDATHRGCHKFVPRHQGELVIEIGDYIYVQSEDDDLWCEGINLRTKQRGIFPTAYAMDLSLFDDESRNAKFFVKYLGSIEVGFHKGNDVLCQAINKLAAARRKTAESNPPPLCCLEITEHGVKMTDRSTQKRLKEVQVSSHLKAKLTSKMEQRSSENDHLFLLKNISFCGYHPKDDRYLGFITKHPLEMRFACHVFQSDRSSKVIAEAIGDAFRKFYQEYLAYVYPTEDIYLE